MGRRYLQILILGALLAGCAANGSAASKSPESWLQKLSTNITRHYHLPHGGVTSTLGVGSFDGWTDDSSTTTLEVRFNDVATESLGYTRGTLDRAKVRQIGTFAWRRIPITTHVANLELIFTTGGEIVAMEVFSADSL